MRKRMIAAIVIGAASLAAWGAAGSSVAAAAETGLAERVEKLEKRVTALETTLAGVTRSGNTLRFSGMNVKVDNASSEASENGLGNLLVGENPGKVTGSNSLVVGDENTVAGWGNLVSGVFNTVTKTASGYNLVAGLNNTAAGPISSILGGGANITNGEFSTVSGGISNHANGYGSSVFGGTGNNANGRCETAPLISNQSC